MYVCIVFCADVDDQRCLGKVRDRNYNPKIELRHEEIDGVEVCYLYDTETGWIEGMNEFGVAVVNSALMVNSDEKEHAKTKQVVTMSKDGQNILSAISKTSVREAVGSMIHVDVKGHSIVSDAHDSFMIETTSQNGLVYGGIGEMPHYRSNHGILHPRAGYDVHSDNNDGNSSQSRMSAMGDLLSSVSSPSDIMPTIRAASGNFDWNSMIRNTEKMKTSSMMLLNCTRKHVTLHLHPNNISSFDVIGFGEKITSEVVWTKPLGKRHPIQEGLVSRIDRHLSGRG